MLLLLNLVGYDQIDRARDIGFSNVVTSDESSTDSAQYNIISSHSHNESQSCSTSIVSHSCHLGHCSFIVPSVVMRTTLLVETHHSSSIIQMFSIDSFPRKRPPRV